MAGQDGQDDRAYIQSLDKSVAAIAELIAELNAAVENYVSERIETDKVITKLLTDVLKGVTMTEDSGITQPGAENQPLKKQVEALQRAIAELTAKINALEQKVG